MRHLHSRRRHGWLWGGALALVVATGVVVGVRGADAQDTGGSFGGSDFGGSDTGGGGSDYGGGGGSDYGGGSDFGSDESSDYGDSSYHGSSSSSGGGGEPLSGMGLCCFVFICFVVTILIFVQHAKNSRLERTVGRPRRGTGGRGGMDVSAVMLAVDWRARAALQAHLNQLAATGDTKTRAGRAALLHEVVIALRRIETSWLYAGAVNAAPASPAEAEATFRRVTMDARSRFKVETVRSVDGRTMGTAAPEMRARAEEGEGVVLITVAIAADGEIPDIASATDANQLRTLMRAFGAIPASQLVALEVIWSPAVENDRMSTAELEMLYPELRRIDERTIGGRVFCGYCDSPFAEELMRCPHCGAPASDAKRR
ncbi:MAG: DUF1517 domain-containing protein, partial [Polyangiales bacterium]